MEKYSALLLGDICYKSITMSVGLRLLDSYIDSTFKTNMNMLFYVHFKIGDTEAKLSRRLCSKYERGYRYKYLFPVIENIFEECMVQNAGQYSNE